MVPIGFGHDGRYAPAEKFVKRVKVSSKSWLTARFCSDDSVLGTASTAKEREIKTSVESGDNIFSCGELHEKSFCKVFIA